MTYNDFLFSQLFMDHCQNNETQYGEELEYDLIYGIVLNHKETFLNSDFNKDTRSEYDCIIDYLFYNVK